MVLKKIILAPAPWVSNKFGSTGSGLATLDFSFSSTADTIAIEHFPFAVEEAA